jgi:transposase
VPEFMFLKISKSKEYTYLRVVESYRDKGLVKQKTIFNIGRLDQLKVSDLENIFKSLLKLINSSLITVNPNEIAEISRLKWGCVEVYKKLWNTFELDSILKRSFRENRFEFNAQNAIFLMILDRLITPSSKLKTYEKQSKYFGLEEVDINHLYRSLDLLADSKEIIEKELFLKNISLFNMQVNVVFYDVTTFYFESNKQNELKDFGFSKDNKINEVQVVMGLLIDLEGRPIGFDLYPGNTFEGHTLEKALDKLKERFNINKVIIVADKGLNSKLNLKTIKLKGYEYIVSSRLKSMSQKVKNEALNLDQYTSKYSEEGKELFKYKVIEYINRVEEIINGEKEVTELKERIICTYSENRAKKDKHDRERFIEKAKDLLDNPSKITNKRGARKYVNTDINCIGLNEDKIEEDSRWDGIYGIQTSTEKLSVDEIQEAYHSLWKIEESFRVLKTNLEARPIYHWTPNRIKGHFVICFIAFLLERTLELELKKNNIDYSVDRIKESLSSLELSVINMEDKQYVLRSNMDKLSKEIFKMLKIKIPKQFEPYVVPTF